MGEDLQSAAAADRDGQSLGADRAVSDGLTAGVRV